MVKIGFLHFTNAPTESSQKAIPTDVDPPTLVHRSKTVVFFHDESIFSANEDQNHMWGTKGQKINKGSGIMVSDFIDEFHGYLALSDSEYETAKQFNREIRKYAREFLEIGEGREGYWTSCGTDQKIYYNYC